MQKFLISFVAFAALAKLTDGLAENTDLKTKYFVANPKSVDYKFTGKKDEHRFGVELKENKQFHHTKTAEDGVRLGCYGHELDGKKYSTHYVADGKGYRLVPHQGLITVYPKDGTEPRKASFVQAFNEEEIVSANIRYFFPEGCQAPEINIDQDYKFLTPTKQPSEVPVRVEAQVPKTSQGKSGKAIDFNENDKNLQNVQPLDRTNKIEKTEINQGRSPAVPIQDPISVQPLVTLIPKDDFTTSRYQTATPQYESTTRFEPVTRSEQNTPAPETTAYPETSPVTQTTPKPTTEPVSTTKFTTFTTFPPPTSPPLRSIITSSVDSSPNIPKFQPITPYKNEKICSDTCCDDNRPQILMSRASPDSCCRGVGKIVVPIGMDLLAKMSMDEIIQITSETSNVEMLKKLLKLVEKYNL